MSAERTMGGGPDIYFDSRERRNDYEFVTLRHLNYQESHLRSVNFPFPLLPEEIGTAAESVRGRAEEACQSNSQNSAEL
jgi:hypothetical protein